MVVAALVEREGRMVLARNHAWAEGVFGLVTGSSEAGEPAAAGARGRGGTGADHDGRCADRRLSVPNAGTKSSSPTLPAKFGSTKNWPNSG